LYEWPGEALNVDLTDFINHLYAIIPSLGILGEAEDTSADTPATVRHAGAGKLTDNGSSWSCQVQMMFHALHLIFFRNTPPSWRAAAFAKRLLTAALHWDPATAIRAVELVTGLVRKDPKLEALLTTEDRSFDGVYQPEVDDPQLCHPFGTSFFELVLLEKNHINPGVRDAARTLAGSLSR
jgi:nucleolar complex protein 3